MKSVRSHCKLVIWWWRWRSDYIVSFDAHNGLYHCWTSGAQTYEFKCVHLNSSSLASTCSCEPDNVNHHISSTPEIWSPLWVFLLICNQSFAEFFACHLNIVPLTHLAVLFFTCHDAHWMIALSVSVCVCHDCCFVHVLVVFFISFTCSTRSQQCVIQRIKEKSPFLKRNTEDKCSRRSTFRLS